MKDIVNNIMNTMMDIEYGFKDKNGINIIDDENKNFWEYYSLLSPTLVLETKCGVCWDQVELERQLFNDNNIPVETYFIYLDDGNNLPSHTFLTYQDNNKYYWFEHSWGDMLGIHEYDNKNSMLDDISKKFILSRINEVDNNYKVYLYKYNKPKYGINCDEFYNYIKTQELIK